jgi:hypothetical protein
MYGVYTVRSPAAPAVRATLASAPLRDYDILPLDLTRLTDVRAFAAALNARVAAGELPSARSSSTPPPRSIPHKHGQTMGSTRALRRTTWGTGS